MVAENIDFYYSKNRVLNNISVKLEEGVITTIIGANGCGKSTLFNVLTKNLKPSRGKVLFNKKDISKIKLCDFAKDVAIVHQHNSSPKDITVEKLVSYGRMPHSNIFSSSKNEDSKRIKWAMEVTDVYSFRKSEISKLSGGQRQRVWITMSLAQNTKYLFLDEPTTYLDIKYQLEILQLVKRLNKEFGMTIIMILHDINQAACFSDKIIGMKDGRIIFNEAPDNAITAENLKVLYGIESRICAVDGRKLVDCYSCATMQASGGHS